MSILGDLLGMFGPDAAYAMDEASNQALAHIAPAMTPTPNIEEMLRNIQASRAATPSPTPSMRMPNGDPTPMASPTPTPSPFASEEEPEAMPVEERATSSDVARALKSMAQEGRSQEKIGLVEKLKTLRGQSKTSAEDTFVADSDNNLIGGSGGLIGEKFSKSKKPVVEQKVMADLIRQKVDPAVAGELIDSGGLNGARQMLFELSRNQAEPMSSRIQKALGLAFSLKTDPGSKLKMASAQLRALGLEEAQIAQLLRAIDPKLLNPEAQ